MKQINDKIKGLFQIDLKSTVGVNGYKKYVKLILSTKDYFLNEKRQDDFKLLIDYITNKYRRLRSFCRMLKDNALNENYREELLSDFVSNRKNNKNLDQPNNNHDNTQSNDEQQKMNSLPPTKNSTTNQLNHNHHHHSKPNRQPPPPLTTKTKTNVPPPPPSPASATSSTNAKTATPPPSPPINPSTAFNTSATNFVSQYSYPTQPPNHNQQSPLPPPIPQQHTQPQSVQLLFIY